MIDLESSFKFEYLSRIKSSFQLLDSTQLNYTSRLDSILYPVHHVETTLWEFSIDLSILLLDILFADSNFLLMYLFLCGLIFPIYPKKKKKR